MKKNFLLTGVTGFIGSRMLALLINQKENVTVAGRNLTHLSADVPCVHVNSIDAETCWDALPLCEIVIHCAASVHQKDSLTLDELFNINTYGSVNLARSAFKKGMKRFIFVSSIGVNGAESAHPFLESDIAEPCSEYALSKHKAEIALTALSKELGFELVIVRPPLVYGKGASGNFYHLVSLVTKAPLLPFGAVNSLRSYISVDNLTDFLYICSTHANAKNQLFLISDNFDISLKEFIFLISKSEKRRVCNIPVPIKLLYFLLALLGKKEEAKKILGKLQIDTSKAQKLLSWNAKVTPSDIFLTDLPSSKHR